MIPLRDNIPTRRRPIVTIAIIAICCFVYFVLQRGGISGPPNAQVVKFGAIPYEITHPGSHCELVNGGQAVACQTGHVSSQPATWLTVLFAMFMHGSLLHIAGNMLFLWIFGNNIEDSMGRGRFVIFYLLGGLVAMAAQTAVNPTSTIPTVGASGAIAGVLGAYIVLYPRARVLTLIFIILFVTVIELPAMLVLGLWILLQLIDASASHGDVAGSGVAYYAHLGGFAFGLLAIRLFANNVNTDYERRSRIPVY